MVKAKRLMDFLCKIVKNQSSVSNVFLKFNIVLKILHNNFKEIEKLFLFELLSVFIKINDCCHAY